LNSINTPATCGGKLLFFGGEASDTLCAAEFKKVAAKGEPCTLPPRNELRLFGKLFLVLQAFPKGDLFPPLKNQ